MGATPSSALALAVVPFGPPQQQEEELASLLSGAQGVLAAAGCSLVGGHSSEGAELSAGGRSGETSMQHLALVHSCWRVTSARVNSAGTRSLLLLCHALRARQALPSLATSSRSS